MNAAQPSTFLLFPGKCVFPLFEAMIPYLFLLQANHIPSPHMEPHFYTNSQAHRHPNGPCPPLVQWRKGTAPHLHTRRISSSLLGPFKNFLFSFGSSTYLVYEIIFSSRYICLSIPFHQKGNQTKKRNKKTSKPFFPQNLPAVMTAFLVFLAETNA